MIQRATESERQLWFGNCEMEHGVRWANHVTALSIEAQSSITFKVRVSEPIILFEIGIGCDSGNNNAAHSKGALV